MVPRGQSQRKASTSRAKPQKKKTAPSGFRESKGIEKKLKTSKSITGQPTGYHVIANETRNLGNV